MNLNLMPECIQQNVPFCLNEATKHIATIQTLYTAPAFPTIFIPDTLTSNSPIGIYFNKNYTSRYIKLDGGFVSDANLNAGKK